MSGADRPLDGLEPWPGPLDGRLQVHLTGFMGCGKSTIGRLLARHLVWNFVDLDALIERHCGCAIAAIFDRDGESAFRVAETFVLRQAVQKPRTVVALGGGTLLAPANRAACRQAATTAWLRCSPAVLRERLGPAKPGRPLWIPDHLEEQLAEREPAYRGADIVVDADAPSAVVTERVLRALTQAAGGRKPPQ